MNCEQIEKISLLIDGELTTAEAREIERHLVTCGDCQNARADFLNLRSQIADYSLLSGPVTPQPALARILSRPGATTIQPSLRSRLLGAFAPRVNSPLAAFAALLLVAFTIGAIALLGYRSPGEIASNDGASEKNEQTPVGAKESTPSTLSTPPTIDSHDAVSDNRGRRPSKVQPREATTNPRKPNSRIKPTRERNAPPPSLPQPRNQAPPTYAGVDERAAPVRGALVRAADTATLTMHHMEQSELLLRAFRNVRLPKEGAALELGYERKRARQLVYQNILLRREADTAGDVQVATLLNSLEPILLDIANLRDKPGQDEVHAIRERVERKSLVALLQINSSALARAND